MNEQPALESRRGARTRRRVEAALLALLAERGYEGTTVRALVTRADVGRSTFYEHYRHKDAVLGSALAAFASTLGAATNGHRPFGFLEPLLAHVIAHRALAARLRTSTAGNVVLARFRALVRTRMAAELVDHFPNAAAERVALASEHATSGLLALFDAEAGRRGPLDGTRLATAWRELTLPGLHAWLGARPPR